MRKQISLLTISASVLALVLLVSISVLAQSPDPLAYLIKSR